MEIREGLIEEIQSIIAASKEAAIRSVDHQRVLMHWYIGQHAKDRAVYGSYLLKHLSAQLEPVHGSGFSRRQLELCRQFYRSFPIANALRSQFSWTHYRMLIRSFVLVEIITTKLTHEDLGQLQMYVNYYDRFEKQAFENQTIGILLCADKNDAMVKISLPENNKTIVASKYQLYLPSERQLMEEMKKTLQQAAHDKERTTDEQENKEPINEEGNIIGNRQKRR